MPRGKLQPRDLGSGFEGVAVLPDWTNPAAYRLVVAQQRGWNFTTPECEDVDDDAAGLNSRGEPRLSRLWIYDPAANSWDHVGWELAPLPALASWVGLSKITALPGGEFIVIERDNRTGDFATAEDTGKVRLDQRRRRRHRGRREGCSRLATPAPVDQWFDHRQA